MIVRAQEVERRVKQARLLQAQIDRVRAVCCSESTRTQSLVRAAGIFVLVGQANFETTLAASLEDSQDVAGLRNLPARQRVKIREDAAQGHRLRLDVALLDK